ncbi:MAG: hypothetical protein K2X86_18375 [Cytophagaceae bacterium]|nr:hypothetical protein [Cytophagaceae bacterium]
MAENSSNKFVLISQTSIAVSLVCSIAIGLAYYLKKDHTLSQFFYLTYISFVNNILMPVFLVTIIYYVITKEKVQSKLKEKITVLLILSLASLGILLIWNVLDVFLILKVKTITYDSFVKIFLKEFFLALALCLPVAGLILTFYALFKKAH